MRGAAVVNASARVAGSSSSDSWQTPENVLDLVRSVEPIGLDPCTSPDNPVGADKFYTESEDGLSQSSPWWTGRGLIFVNPPYSNVGRWMEKASSGWLSTVICLVPARTDTKWFHEFVWAQTALVCFWKGRLKFKGAPSCAPFPSAIVCYTRITHTAGRFDDVFGKVGKVVVS